MNYIKLMNQFWQLRRSKRITNLQADLYYFLLQECNARNWENPFQCSNGLICTSIGISEKSLIDARNVLQQIGLIVFQNGVTKRQSPVYQLEDDYCNKVSNPVSINVSNRGGNPVSNRGGNPVNIYNKQNETETKPNNSASNEAVQEEKISKPLKPKKERKKDSAQKKKEATIEYWQEIVKAWFEFYKDKFIIEPTFKGPAPKALQSIVKRLKELALANGCDWSEEYALRCVKHFFELAWQDKWLKEHFLLHILQSQFDTIVSNGNNKGSTKNRSSGVAAFKAKLGE